MPHGPPYRVDEPHLVNGSAELMKAWDTVPLMELVAGGRKNLEKGTENTFLSAYYSAIVLDNL